VVTSPPYWGLRDYGVAGQLGLEKSPEEYVEKMVAVFREVRRVLRDDGTCWVNMGDTYAAGGKGGGGSYMAERREGAWQKQSKLNGWRSAPPGLKEKDLVGIPWRLAFGLQGDGWYLRSDIIWAKGNPMPESVRDRPTRSHEYVFLLSKAERYYYDGEAIKEKTVYGLGDRTSVKRGGFNGKTNVMIGREAFRSIKSVRNRRSVWTITTSPYPGAHFATFPPALVEPCIKAGTSEYGCCAGCGAPYGRVTSVTANAREKARSGTKFEKWSTANRLALLRQATRLNGHVYRSDAVTVGWEARCECKFEISDLRRVVPCRVLDPFAGSGTTGAVALCLGREAVLIELNAAYVPLIEERIGRVTRVTAGKGAL
jgi:DNA modification methylase